jgi:excisionase family DNA binding protein
MMASDAVLNAQAAAELLGAHVETIRRMARKGAIPAFKVGKDWRFRKTALLAWSETNPGLQQQRCICVIDDDAGVRRLMRRHLEPSGYRVLTAASGAEGLDHIHNQPIDLVLLDLEMPVMNGPAFIGAMSRAGIRIPVILVSGYPDSALMMEACRFGPLMLVPKPIEKKMLLAAVAMTLAGATAEADAG